MPRYDYLIVGAGIFGAVFAREATDAGKRCLVLEKRGAVGGNLRCETVEGIVVHKYGAHILHTSDREVWEYMNRYSEFNNYINTPVARYGDELYNLPFNMNTFSRLWGVHTPAEAQAEIRRQVEAENIGEPRNLEEQALKLVGRDIYEKLVKGYTEKQWGRDCRDLPAFIIRRLPLRFTFNNNYFSDRWQGIPIEGFNAIVEKLLEGSDVLTDTDYFEWIRDHPDAAEKTVFTGMIDEFFGCRLGHLAYRSLRFDTQVLDEANHQGNAVVNYTAREVPYTRIIEHKHFLFGDQPKTVISYEYPVEWKPGLEPFYPVNDEKNQALYHRYEALARECPNVIFGGRLGSYRYYDMDKAVREALDAARRELGTGTGGT